MIVDDVMLYYCCVWYILISIVEYLNIIFTDIIKQPPSYITVFLQVYDIYEVSNHIKMSTNWFNLNINYNEGSCLVTVNPRSPRVHS